MFSFLMDFIIIFLAFFLLIDIVDYLNVNVGDTFVDDWGIQYVIVEKNPIFARVMAADNERVLPLIWLCSKCCKIN